MSDLPQWLRTDLDLRRGIRLRRGFGFCGFGGDPLGFLAAVIQLRQIRSAWIVADLDLRRGIPLILLRRVRSASGRRRFGPRGLWLRRIWLSAGDSAPVDLLGFWAAVI